MSWYDIGGLIWYKGKISFEFFCIWKVKNVVPNEFDFFE